VLVAVPFKKAAPIWGGFLIAGANYACSLVEESMAPAHPGCGIVIPPVIVLAELIPRHVYVR